MDINGKYRPFYIAKLLEELTDEDHYLTTMQISTASHGQAILNVYDMSGRLVMTTNLGHINEGTSTHTIDCSKLAHGMYLVNVLMGETKASSKLVVR